VVDVVARAQIEGLDRLVVERGAAVRVVLARVGRVERHVDVVEQRDNVPVELFELE
jgi:hypothetical protein